MATQNSNLSRIAFERKPLLNDLEPDSSISDGFGLALSGGGSRAAAFHCGTLEALVDLGLVGKIEVISTVSGGSLFGAAWMTAREDGLSDADFLGHMREELAKGFVRRSLRPRLLKTVLPGYSRSNVIAETFDKVFFRGKRLNDVPENPRLCLNTTILNNGQVGKFSKGGFSAWGLYCERSYPTHFVPLGDFPLALAVAASAAFPIGLPPVRLKRELFPEDVEFKSSFTHLRALDLTDGGVLENLGIQTLIKSSRFRSWHMIVSDAGTEDTVWTARYVRNTLRGFGAWVFGGATLDRVVMIMNSKQNRWAREQIIDKARDSLLAQAVRTGQTSPGVDALLAEPGRLEPRIVLFVRVNQTWSRFIRAIPDYYLRQLGATQEQINKCKGKPGAPLSHQEQIQARESLLNSLGIDLTQARDAWRRLGGTQGQKIAGSVSTSFTGLTQDQLDCLAQHAAWQVYASHAVYGRGLSTKPPSHGKAN